MKTGDRSDGSIAVVPSMERLWVVGPTGAGKSTVAAAIAQRLEIPLIDLDELFWRPGWRKTPKDEFARTVEEALAGERWVVAGNYGAPEEGYTRRVTAFVWLDLPLRVTFWRLVKRCVRRSVYGIPCCNGNRETLLKTFWSWDSLLVWSLQTHYRYRRRYARGLRRRGHVRLESQAAVDAWLAVLPNECRVY